MIVNWKLVERLGKIINLDYIYKLIYNCNFYLVDEIKEVDKLKHLLKRKTFNQRKFPKFSEFVYKIKFKYWISYVSIYWFVIYSRIIGVIYLYLCLYILNPKLIILIISYKYACFYFN